MNLSNFHKKIAKIRYFSEISFPKRESQFAYIHMRSYLSEIISIPSDMLSTNSIPAAF